MPRRIQLSRRKGFNLQEVSRALNGLPAVKVTRPGPFGNPFKVDGSEIVSPSHSVFRFKCMLIKNPELRGRIREELRGKNLACWCKEGEPCHVDVLLEVANGG